jgi:hypothetical protein
MDLVHDLGCVVFGGVSRCVPSCPVLAAEKRRRLVAVEPGGPLLVVPPPGGVTRGEEDELGGVAVASRRA